MATVARVFIRLRSEGQYLPRGGGEGGQPALERLWPAGQTDAEMGGRLEEPPRRHSHAVLSQHPLHPRLRITDTGDARKCDGAPRPLSQLKLRMREEELAR